LGQPFFLGFREDKRASGVRREIEKAERQQSIAKVQLPAVQAAFNAPAIWD